MDHYKPCILSDFAVFGLFPLSLLQLSCYSLSALPSSKSSLILCLPVAKERDMSQSQPFEFRSPHGIRKIESHTRSWNGITVRNIVHYPDVGKAWHDISSHETTVAIVLGQVGGY